MTDNIENIYELTPLQQGLLIETLSKPDNDAYIIQFILTLDAAHLDEKILHHAWKTVLDRHAILRSAFYWQDLEKPVQVVLHEVSLPWEVLDWCQHITPEVEWENWQAADLQKPLVLDAAPLFRCTLIRLDESTTRFVWTVHHLINDGWSYPILLNEMLELYQAGIEKKNLSLPLPRPFVDYIDWLQQQNMEQAKQFWHGQLAGFTETTPIGTSKHTRNRQADYQTQYQLLSEAQTNQLRQFARQHCVTLNTLLQGAWAMVLARYSNTEDVLFGGVVSGRPATLAGIETMVGMFTNTLPVRVKLDGDTYLLPWLQTLQQQQAEQEQYAHCSLVDLQGWSDIPRGTPLFESIFAYENYPLEARWEKLGLIRDMQAVERVPYPLSFVAMLRGVMELHVHYDACRFTPSFITRLLGHVQTLLTNMLAQPDACLKEISLLTEVEKHNLLETLMATTCEYPRNACVHDLFERQVANTPDVIALEDDGVALTYCELNAKANQLAVWLRKQGVQPNMPVAICLPRSPELIVSVLGIMKAGGVFLPLDPSYPTERLQYMLENAHASILLTTIELQVLLPLTSVKQVFTAWEALSHLSMDNVPSPVKPQDLAYCLYTSGSTGKPKGVMMPHQSTVNLITWHQRDKRLGLPARTVQFSPISFDVSIQDILCTLCCGGTLVLIKEALRRDATGLLRFLDSQCIERIFLPFVALQQLANVALGWMPPRLRDVITAGEQLHLTDALKAWFRGKDCILHNHYGPTETHLITAYVLQGQVDDWPLLPPIGQALANSYLYVLDKHKELVPHGIPGELYVAGECLASGYINRPELTDERFLPNPFGVGRLYRTSDLVYWQEDGHLMFWGRADNQLKIRGFRIEPGEIEAVLNQHPAVQDGAVVVHEPKPGDKRLVAYCVPKTDTPDLAAQVQHFLQEKLPDYMVPSAVMVLAAFPLTPSGKLDRKALPVPVWGTNVSVQALPSTPTEQQLADIWQEVLGLEAVGVHDSFFALGGHSLLATQVISRVSQAFGLDVPFHYLFEHPTIAGLAVQVDNLLRNQFLLVDGDDIEEELELL